MRVPPVSPLVDVSPQGDGRLDEYEERGRHHPDVAALSGIPLAAEGIGLSPLRHGSDPATDTCLGSRPSGSDTTPGTRATTRRDRHPLIQREAPLAPLSGRNSCRTAARAARPHCRTSPPDPRPSAPAIPRPDQAARPHQMATTLDGAGTVSRQTQILGAHVISTVLGWPQRVNRHGLFVGTRNVCTVSSCPAPSGNRDCGHHGAHRPRRFRARGHPGGESKCVAGGL
jgi:hypothetical protein